jgi:hypothetical protein
VFCLPTLNLLLKNLFLKKFAAQNFETGDCVSRRILQWPKIQIFITFAFMFNNIKERLLKRFAAQDFEAGYCIYKRDFSGSKFWYLYFLLSCLDFEF